MFCIFVFSQLYFWTFRQLIFFLCLFVVALVPQSVSMVASLLVLMMQLCCYGENYRLVDLITFGFSMLFSLLYISLFAYLLVQWSQTKTTGRLKNDLTTK